MNQLFVCHTQYNLILAVGLSSSNDDLILFKDFDLTDVLKQRLIGRFRKCLFLKGNYPKEQLTAKHKFVKILEDNRAIKAFITEYDRIFIVDDMCIQEMYALKLAHRKNNAVEMAWLEDGTNAYFRNNIVSKGMGATPLKRFIRKVFFGASYSLFSFYDLGVCMGAHRRLTVIYVCFPDHVRSELAGKNRREITDNQLINGMEFMFKDKPYPMEDHSLLIAMDLLSVYGNSVGRVNDTIKAIVQEAIQTGKKVYCKYHPRETEVLSSLAEVEKLKSEIGIESYLINTTAKHMTVIGFKSNALQIAKKLDFEVISLVNHVDIDTELITNFYKSIGIKCL